MSATYFGLFDGHASHIVSLIVSKLLHMHVKVCEFMDLKDINMTAFDFHIL